MATTVGQLLTAITGTHMMEWMGPYSAGDGNTKVVRTRKIVIIPHLVVGLFLASPNGITPRYYFETIYTQLQNEGKDGGCLALT
jgi:hypothetical protein